MRAFFTTTVLAAMLAGCTPTADLAEQRVRQLLEIWETGDASHLAEIATPDVVYDDIPNAERFRAV